MAKNITLIRHAAIAAELNGHYIGRSDPPLSWEGQQWAEQLARHFAASHSHPFDMVWSSPALRAYQTAEPIVNKIACDIRIDEQLHEIDFGTWEGLTFDQIVCKDPHLVNQWAACADDFSFPDGESVEHFNHRIEAIAKKIQHIDSEHLAIISHGGMVRGLICRLLGWGLKDHLKFSIKRGGYATMQLNQGHAVFTGLYNHVN